MTPTPDELPETERQNPRTTDLDLRSTADLLRAINAEDRRVADAVAVEIDRIATVVDRVAAALAAGGRLHYFGAGTSGRLAVLDASECPPTFGVEAATVVGHIAGGPAALVSAVEGAEDDRQAGAAAARAAGLGRADVAVVLTASGSTPWCLGVLEHARAAGAFTVAIVCNSNSKAGAMADVTIAPLVGEEVLSGSTRLKAGTAQKLVLNMISTGAMIRSGRTYGNLMVGVAATNAKLRARAARLTRTITGVTDVDATLRAAEFDVRTACVMLRRSVDAATARSLLAAAGGHLRAVIG